LLLSGFISYEVEMTFCALQDLGTPWRRSKFGALVLAFVVSSMLLPGSGRGADSAGLSAEPRLRPSGLEGAVILDTGARPTAANVARFLKLAKGAEAKLVFITLGDAKAEVVLDLVEAEKAGLLAIAKAGHLKIIKVDSPAAANLQPTIDDLHNATGVWLFTSGDPAKAVTFLGGAAAKELQGVRLRGGVVAASGAAATILPSQFLNAKGEPQTGLGLLPDMLVARASKQEGSFEVGLAKAFDAAQAKAPGMLGVHLGDGAVLLVNGREMRSLGEGPVSLLLARSPTREPRVVNIRANGQVDFNEMRRAALGRAQQNPYPPKEVATPEVPKGTLIIVGGGGLPAPISRRFFELGGGAEGTFVVLPISNPDPLRPADIGDGFLRRLGAKNIFVIKAREQNELEDPKNIEVLKKATGVWFGGGRQWRFVDAYEGTKIHELFRDVLRRGGVIGGSSAGATIQGDYLCRGAPGGPNNIICEGYEQGLGFLPGVAIDQHFTQRNRLKDMVLLMKTYPQFLGIGLDEATAIVVQGHVAEIMGTNSVHIYDRRKPVEEGKPDHESFKAGARYDLKERKALGAKEG
jgi:cyanophycinase